MKILHVVPGLEEGCNGIAVAARLIANEQNANLIEVRRFASGEGDFSTCDEVWVHSAWLPMVLRSCRRVVKSGKRLVRMSHANYDPVRLAYHGWKKRLVSLIDRYYLRKADKVIATCQAEVDWIRAYEPRVRKVEVMDLKRFFDFSCKERKVHKKDGTLHVLYLGRRHPLKGVEYLETAVRQINNSSAPLRLCVKIIFNAFGEEKENAWEWCDVLVLPTLSENFGLVVAEALERGKFVITTDGAPAWCDGENYGGRLICLNGFRNGTRRERIALLENAIEKICGYIREKS